MQPARLSPPTMFQKLRGGVGSQGRGASDLGTWGLGPGMGGRAGQHLLALLAAGKCQVP